MSEICLDNFKAFLLLAIFDCIYLLWLKPPQILVLEVILATVVYDRNWLKKRFQFVQDFRHADNVVYWSVVAENDDDDDDDDDVASNLQPQRAELRRIDTSLKHRKTDKLRCSWCCPLRTDFWKYCEWFIVQLIE